MSLLHKKVNRVDGKSEDIQIDAEPDYCPLCNKHQTPTFVTAFKSSDKSIGKECQMIFRCANQGCLSFFIAYYWNDYTQYHDNIFRIRNLRPQNLIPVAFEDEIRKLSNNFCEIYKEANFAERRGYKQIAGAGYRKALEYLVKDFCISVYPQKADEIKITFLNTCIQNYVDDVRIKECATLATWLGNDETHYVRRWEDKDITDLMALITLTKNWIVTHIQTEKYISTMKPKA